MKFVHLHSRLLCEASSLHSISNFCPGHEEAEEFLHGCRLYREGRSVERRVKRSPHVSGHGRGVRVGEWEARMKQSGEGEGGDYCGPASEEVTRGKQDDRFYFFVAQQSLFTHTLFSPFFLFAVIFNHSFSCLLEPRRPPPLFVLSPLFFLFTCLIASLSTFFNRAVIGEH